MHELRTNEEESPRMHELRTNEFYTSHLPFVFHSCIRGISYIFHSLQLLPISPPTHACLKFIR
ncbi:MAG: hypothetical protein IPI96_14570 [Saprospiraceae bacterium]|nr:hypothetical protein [Saprospiraceae bacterium]